MIYEIFKEIVQKEIKTYKLQFPYSLCVPRPIDQPPPIEEKTKKKKKKVKKDKKEKKLIKSDSKIDLEMDQEEEEEEEKIKIPMIQRLQNSTSLTEEWFQNHFSCHY